MVRKSSKPPPSNRVSTRRAPKTHPHDASSPPSSSPSQNVAQPVQQSTQSESIPGSIPDCDWTSAFGLSQSDIQRASMSSSIPKRNTKANQQANRKHARNGAPARIMTSLNGVPIYSHGTSANPSVSSVRNAAELQKFIVEDSTPATGKIFLPRPDPTPHYYRSAIASSSYPFAKPTAPPTHQQPPSESTTPQEPPPFHPAKCHWRALRDVAFVLDGGMDVSSEDLCALLRFRYAKTDPLMARVELADLQAMYLFCKGWPKEMYEKHAGGRIRLEMGQDLKLMREGGVGGVNEDF